MVCEARAAAKLGMTETDLTGKIEDDLSSMGFDLDVPYESEKIMKYMKGDKKVRTGTITVVVPETEGKCGLRTIPIDELGDYILAGLPE